MFKFDFKVEEENSALFENATTQKEKSHDFEEPIAWYGSQEIFVNDEILESLDVCKLNSTELHIDAIPIRHMIPKYLLNEMAKKGNSTNDIVQAELSHTDLIPGIYEGGAKVWECTDDLLNYMSKNYAKHTWKGKRVLDLGCGAGLLGIYAHLLGAYVEFQDYNSDVLQKITVPNVLLNIPQLPPLEQMGREFRFFAGDWQKYADLTKNDDKFDVILTSETIYNAENHQKLLAAICQKLSGDGIALVAAKTHYFGVGGGVRQFMDLVERGKCFQGEVLWTSDTGVAREIIKLQIVK